ncbi:MAG: ABC transporter ATP-binding protein/permease [Candidatus Thiodiazotropha sp. (ex Ctena orbiculata)]|nr:ABC transporter ATP-binding protein/permease [Candidatus Thiodiazotropha taylori]
MPSRSEAIPSLRASYRRILQAAGEQTPALRRALRLYILAGVFEGLAFACFYPLITALLANPVEMNSAWIWLGVMLLLVVGGSLLNWRAGDFAFTDRLAGVNYGLRLRLGEQLRRMPLHTLARYQAGELGAVLSGNVEQTVTPMANLSAVVIRTLVVPSVAVAATFMIDWRLALAMILVIFLAIPLYHWQRRMAGVEHTDLATAHAQVESAVVEYIQGLPVLRALSQTGARSRNLQASLEELQRLQVSHMYRSGPPNLAFSSLAQLGIVLVLALGVSLVSDGGLDMAALAALLVIAMRFTDPLSLFAGITVVFDYMEAGLRRMDELLSIKPLVVWRPHRQPDSFAVSFEKVSFSYGDEESEPALQDLSFTIPECSMTALVGPSGSGKTTVTRLLMRYADLRSGTISIGGVDLRQMEPDVLMKRISVVFQDVYLFNDTILENIRMGNPGASDEAVLEAARKANCEAFISRLPDGFDTAVGDIGGSLSGGERQRISIARAILKDAPIVILDEPTAALDTQSEVAVQQAINALVEDRTVIVIAHRLSTIKGADQILVLDKGSIVERGSHAELVAQKGKYHDMWLAQQSIKKWH